MSNTSKIKIDVDLNENKVPQKIKWTADDSDIQDSPAKAMLLSLWDEEKQHTLKVDLWTTEMQVDEMKQFFHQTLLTMADTFEKATGENLIMEDLRDYCAHFAEKMEIAKKD